MKKILSLIITAVIMLNLIMTANASAEWNEKEDINQMGKDISPALGVISVSELDPETVSAYVKKDPVRVVSGTLNRGDTVNIIGKEEDKYRITDYYNNEYLVEARYVRTTEKSNIKEFSVYYTKAKASAYDTAYPESNGTELEINTPFLAKDELYGIVYGTYIAEGEEVNAYISLENLSEKELSIFNNIDGYIASDIAELFDNPDRTGNPIKKVVKRAHVHVIEQDGDSLYIEVTDSSISAYGMKGYIDIDDFTDEAPAVYYSPAGGSSVGGGSTYGGGSSSGSGVTYGEDIFISHRSPLDKTNNPGFVKLAYTESSINVPVTGERGTVFTDGLELIIAVYEKGEKLQLINKDNDIFWTVLENHRICKIPANSVRLEDEPEEPEMEEHDAFTGDKQVALFDNPALTGEPVRKIPPHAHIHIYEQVGTALRIKITDTTISSYGQEGYISIADYIDERPVYEYYYIPSGSAGSSGGNNSSGASSGSEWSAPVL